MLTHGTKTRSQSGSPTPGPLHLFRHRVTSSALQVRVPRGIYYPRGKADGRHTWLQNVRDVVYTNDELLTSSGTTIRGNQLLLYRTLCLEFGFRGGHWALGTGGVMSDSKPRTIALKWKDGPPHAARSPYQANDYGRDRLHTLSGLCIFHLQRNCLELLILRRSARKLYTLGSDQFIIVSKTLGT